MFHCSESDDNNCILINDEYPLNDFIPTLVSDYDFENDTSSNAEHSLNERSSIVLTDDGINIRLSSEYF